MFVRMITMSSTIIQKPVVLTKSGHSLTVAPGTEKPVPADEWLRKIGEWRKKNEKHIESISVEEFLAEKHEDVRKGLA